MRRPHTIVLVAAALASALVAAAAAAGSAATSTPWNRISGPTAPGAQLGLARTPDGVLHVIWNRGATPTSIFETRLSSAGKDGRNVDRRRRVNGNNGLALVVMRDGRCSCSPSATGASTRSPPPRAAAAGATAEPRGEGRSPNPQG